MFRYGQFNQPLKSWNVSSVVEMAYMFNENKKFNQDITTWCVSQISEEPENFSTGSPLTIQNKPKWGTCPN
jgi:hypothetical protein